MARGRRLVRDFARSVAIAAVVGLVLGVATQLGQGHLPDTLRPIANSISPWLAVAFGVGAAAGRPLSAIAAGWTALILALVGYYAMVNAQFGYGGSSSALVVWAVAAVAGGLVFGLSGWLWRNGSGWWSAVPVGLLAAAFLADAVYVYIVVQPVEKPAALVYALVGAVTPAVLGRGREGRAAAYIAVLPALVLAAMGYFAINALWIGSPV
jgi:hypothetical protein